MKKIIITVLALLAVVLTISCSQEVPSPNQSSSDKVDSQEVKVVVRDGLIYVEFSEDQNTILVHVDAQGTVTPYEYWTSQVNIIPAAGGNPEENFPYNYILGSNGLPILKEEVDAVYYLKDAYLSFGNISALSVTETNPIELKSGIQKATQIVVDCLDKFSKPVKTDKEISQIAVLNIQIVMLSQQIIIKSFALLLLPF